MKRALAMMLAWLISLQMVPAKELTMEEVSRLAAMKEAIQWEDIAPYGGDDIGSGLCIISIPVADQPYLLWVGMDRSGGEIQYLLLRSAENSRSYMDLWTENMEDFLKRDHRISRFRYDRVAEFHASGEPGVNPYPFRNVDSEPVLDFETAVDRAREEVTVEYDAVEVFYDPEAEVWGVLFYSTENPEEISLGGGQTVYMGTDGITRLVVYGE